MKKIFILLFTITFVNSTFCQTTSNDLGTLVAAADKAFNDHNIKEYVSYFSDDASIYSTVDYKEPVKGKQAIEQLVSGWFAITPDIKSKTYHIYISGDTVIEEFEFGGTVGVILPGYPENLKNKSYNVKACSISTIENGKIKTMNLYYDYLSILNQLGWTNIVPGH